MELGIARHILLCSSESINCADSNETKVYAMLMGCRELSKLGGHQDIIEGDSFSVIQWRSSQSICPWRVADSEEEVHQLSRH